jgi:glycosyltransferase involved in cell wall biosynthesis
VARPQAFLLYRDSPLRREALALGPGTASRYSLYGLDELEHRGFDVAHNLAPRRSGPSSHVLGAVLDRVVRVGGGYSGDFPTVLASRRDLGHADVVFSTVDTVGIPLVLLFRAGLVRPPIVYAAIGLPERLAQLSARAHRFYLGGYRRLHTIVAYGWGEVDALREWLGETGPRVVFLPFGVDVSAFRPAPEARIETDVVSVGADPRRDYGLLLDLARRRSEWSFRIVAARDHLPALASRPANVEVETDVPFDVARARLTTGRVVVLPVRDNTYSGATTVLLQAMSSGKPVVVTRTAAIARGYHLEDGLNCRLIEPAGLASLEHAVSALLADDEGAAALGARARETVERHLTWQRYTDAVGDLLLAACGRTTVSP